MNKNYLHCKFRWYHSKEKGNFRFSAEKSKNILQRRGFCVEKFKNSDEGSVFPWDFCKGGWGWSKYAKFCVFT